MFQSDAFALLERCMRSEFDELLYQAKLDGITFLFDPEKRADAYESMRQAARLQVAIEVLREYSESDKEKFTIKVDSP